MPRIRRNSCLPDPSAVTKLIERYVKIERRITAEDVAGKVGICRASYYNRIRDPTSLTLGELRSFAKALKIPQEEMFAALAEAIKY